MRATLSSLHLRMPSTYLVSLLAGLTTWITLLSWRGFAEKPSGYLVPLFGACLIVAVTGMLLRTTRVPTVVVPLVQLVVLAVWLHAKWAGAEAFGGLLPTPESMRAMITTLQDAGTAAQTYSSPVPRSVPQFYPLLLVAGSCTAVLVDFLACGLRRAPLAGLPLLAVYTAPVSILQGGVSWLEFAVAAISFLFLLAADESLRLTHWGHQLADSDRVFDTQSTTVSSASIWSSARRIGFTATGLAVVLPILVPSLSTDIFNGNGNGAGGHGDSVTISNPMVDLKRDLTQGRDVELVRARTPGDPSYLRTWVLDTFDGTAWRPPGRDIPVKQRAAGLVTRPPGLFATVPARKVPWTVHVDDDFSSRWLPTPYPVYSIVAPGDWRYDVNTLDFISAADHQTTAGISYRLRALQLSPTAVQLADAGPVPASVFTPYTALPRSMPQSVRDLAEGVTKGAGSRFGMAVRLQNWFRQDGGFTYSLARSPGNGLNELVHFLGTGPGSRTGYCEQFAAAMALMGRTLGIPSRVAVGFLHPNQIGPDTYSYSSHDLHAWPEMYFEGIGWVRFEPTPASRTGPVPAYTQGKIPHQQAPKSAPARPTASQSNRFDRATNTTGAAGGGKGGSSGGLPTPLLVLVSALVLAAVAATPRLVRASVRRRRWHGTTGQTGLAEAGWAELRASALDLGLAWDDRVTVRAQARELVRAFGRPGAEETWGRGETRGPAADPEATAALTRLVERVERARFAPPATTGSAAGSAAGSPDDGTIEAGQRAAVQDEVGRCVAALAAGAGRQRRTKATWLPASLVTGRFAAASATARGRGAGLAADAGVDHAI